MGRWDDDETEETTVMTKKPTAVQNDDAPAPKRIVRSGWGSTDRSAATGNDEFAKRLKVTEDTQIIKFLDDAPYARYRQHWVERKGQMSFTCIADVESSTSCPLCDAGSRPSWRFNFNVILLTPGEEPVLRSYEVGARVIDSLKNFNDHPAMGPLPKHYWTVSRSGRGATTSTNHQLVKESDLADWGLEPLSRELLAHFDSVKYSDDIIKTPSRQTLASVALELAN